VSANAEANRCSRSSSLSRGGQQIPEGGHHSRAAGFARQLGQRLEPGRERGCRSGPVARQQRQRGAVVVIEVVQRARNQLERPGARRDPRPGDPAARDCGSSQRPRPSAGHAERREPGHAQPIGNRVRISGNRREPERRGRGTAIARPVEGNEPDAAIGRELLAKAKVQPGTRSPVEVHHHVAARVTRITDPQHPAAATYLSLPHLTTITMRPPRESTRPPG
jgi:hypothetical protein